MGRENIQDFLIKCLWRVQKNPKPSKTKKFLTADIKSTMILLNTLAKSLLYGRDIYNDFYAVNMKNVENNLKRRNWPKPCYSPKNHNQAPQNPKSQQNKTHKPLNNLMIVYYFLKFSPSNSQTELFSSLSLVSGIRSTLCDALIGGLMAL